MEQNHNMLRGISENGGIVFYGVDSTEIVRDMERLHKTSAVTTAALGRLLTAASMMGIMLKSTQDSVTLQIKGGGPAGRLLAVSDGTGNVKGYVEHPVVELPPRADGHLDVGTAVGKDGTLDVIRDLGMREPYIGQVPLTSGEIAEDVTTYFAISEQIPTVCALGVLVDKDLSVRCAGGFVVQLLPGATEEEIEHLEKNIKAMPSVTTMLEQGMSVRDMLELALQGFQPDILDSYHVTYKCDCSLERVEKMIRSLGKKEVEKMRDEDPIAEVNCQFCNKNYRVDLNDVLKNLFNYVLGFLSDLGPHLLELTSGIVSMVVTGVLSLVFSIYMLSGRDTLMSQCRRVLRAYVPARFADPLTDVVHLTADTFTRFVTGQLIEACILGGLCAAGMLFIQADYAPLIGVIIGASAIIPVAGAYIGAIVSALLLVMVSPIKALVFLVFLVVLQQIEGNVIYPKVVGTSIGLPGIWVLAAVTIGGGVGGLVGVLLSVPVASVLYALLRRDVHKRLACKE